MNAREANELALENSIHSVVDPIMNNIIAEAKKGNMILWIDKDAINWEGICYFRNLDYIVNNEPNRDGFLSISWSKVKNV